MKMIFSVIYFLAPGGAQGVTLSVCLSVCLSSTNLSKALNLHLSLMGLSQVCLRLVLGQSWVSLRSVSGLSLCKLCQTDGA